MEDSVEKVKRSTVHVVICVGLLCLIWGGFILLSEPMKQKGLENIAGRLEEKVDCTILMDLSKKTNEEKGMQLQGWVTRMDSIMKRIHLILQDVDSGERLVITGYSNEDAVEFPLKKHFSITVDPKKVNANSCYNVFFALTYEALEFDEDGKSVFNEYQKMISTNRYLYNGELYSYDPRKLEEPLFKDEAMKNVINNGELLFINKNEGVWIYKYQDKLYWVANNEFRFEEKRNTYVAYHVYTTEWDKLPDRMKKDGFVNYDFRFEDCEMSLELEDYRVVSRTLPSDINVTWIGTGIYKTNEKRWVWQTFIPIMEAVE